MAKFVGLSTQQRKMDGRHTNAVSRSLRARVSEPVATTRQSCPSPSLSVKLTRRTAAAHLRAHFTTHRHAAITDTQRERERKSSAGKRTKTRPLKAEPWRCSSACSTAISPDCLHVFGPLVVFLLASLFFVVRLRSLQHICEFMRITASPPSSLFLSLFVHACASFPFSYMNLLSLVVLSGVCWRGDLLSFRRPRPLSLLFL